MSWCFVCFTGIAPRLCYPISGLNSTTFQHNLSRFYVTGRLTPQSVSHRKGISLSRKQWTSVSPWCLPSAPPTAQSSPASESQLLSKLQPERSLLKNASRTVSLLPSDAAATAAAYCEEVTMVRVLGVGSDVHVKTPPIAPSHWLGAWESAQSLTLVPFSAQRYTLFE